MSVEKLARALCAYDGHKHDECNTVDFRREALHRQVERILADPGPLLEALAEAGVLEVEHDVQWCDAEDYHFTAYGDECDRDCTRLAGHEGDHECVNGRSWPREAGDSAEPEQRRYVTEWRPTDGR